MKVTASGPSGWRGDLLLAGLALILALGLSLAALAPRGVWEGGEARSAEMAREMLDNGDWVTPHLNGVPYLVQPPLLPWLGALGFALGGVGGGTARVISLTAGLGCLGLVFVLGRALWSRRAGLAAAVVLASSAGFALHSQAFTPDMPLCLACLLAWHGAWQTRQDELWGRYLFWLGATAAFLLGGLWGLGLPVFSVLVFAFLGGEWRLLRRLASWRGWLPLLLLGGGWLLAAAWRNPGFLAFFLIQDLRPWLWQAPASAPGWGRIMGLLLAGLLPWLGLLPWAWRYIWPGPAWRGEAARPWLLLVCAGGVGLALMLVGRRPGLEWGLPLLPLAALVWGRAWAGISQAGAKAPSPSWLAWCLGLVALSGLVLALLAVLTPVGDRDPAWRGVGFWLVGAPAALSLASLALFAARARLAAALAGPLLLALVMAGCLLAVLPRLDARFSLRQIMAPVGAALTKHDQVATYNHFHPGAAFYSGRQVLAVGSWPELEWGLLSDPQQVAWFLPDDRAFLEVLQNPARRVLAVGATRDFLRLKRDLARSPGLALHEWARMGGRSLFSNRPR